MGNCCGLCSSNAEDVYEDNATNDKSNLLGNPVGENSRVNNYFSTNHRDRNSIGKIDEQEKLNRILNDTAKSYIDVPALNSPIDQPNFTALEKQYTDKINDILKDSHVVLLPVTLLAEVTQLEQMLSVEPISETDRNMVNDMYKQISTALNGFKVDYTDSIIIPFDGYPKFP